MRPRYETQKDLDNEKQVIDLICNLTNATAHKLPISDHLDFAMFRDNDLVALVEIKRRKVNSQEWPTYMISYRKVKEARQMSWDLSVPAYLFVQFNDRIGYVNFDAEFKAGYNGRRDTNDPGDINLVCYYSMADFKWL